MNNKFDIVDFFKDVGMFEFVDKNNIHLYRAIKTALDADFKDVTPKDLNKQCLVNNIEDTDDLLNEQESILGALQDSWVLSALKPLCSDMAAISSYGEPAVHIDGCGVEAKVVFLDIKEWVDGVAKEDLPKLKGLVSKWLNTLKEVGIHRLLTAKSDELQAQA